MKLEYYKHQKAITINYLMTINGIIYELIDAIDKNPDIPFELKVKRLEQIDGAIRTLFVKLPCK